MSTLPQIDGSNLYREQCQRREEAEWDAIVAYIRPLTKVCASAHAAADTFGLTETKARAELAEMRVRELGALLYQLAWKGALQRSPVWQNFVRNLENSGAKPQ